MAWFNTFRPSSPCAVTHAPKCSRIRRRHLRRGREYLTCIGEYTYRHRAHGIVHDDAGVLAIYSVIREIDASIAVHSHRDWAACGKSATGSGSLLFRTNIWIDLPCMRPAEKDTLFGNPYHRKGSLAAYAKWPQFILVLAAGSARLTLQGLHGFSVSTNSDARLGQESTSNQRVWYPAGAALGERKVEEGSMNLVAELITK